MGKNVENYKYILKNNIYCSDVKVLGVWRNSLRPDLILSKAFTIETINTGI